MNLFRSLKPLIPFLVAGYAAAQCPTIDFDSLAAGTRVSTQYAGVTFSSRWVSGAVGPLPVIYNPSGTTTSEPQCLSAWGDGTNEFSEEYLRLDFDRDQTEVTFSLGVRVGCFATDTVAVRLYDAGGVLRRTMNVPVNGDLTVESVLVFVRAMRTDSGVFRRLEIEGGPAGGCAARFELIDDLTFNLDDTPPIAEITSPTPLDCVCNGTTVFGSAYDPDGPILNWRLERKAPDAVNWTLIALSSSEVNNGALSVWSTAAAQGYYILRLTVTNGCELTAVATTVVWLDRNFDSFAIRSPVTAGVYGGTLCLDGTAWDHCGGTLTVDHRPLGGMYTPFDSIAAPWVITDPLGTWNTRTSADGNYEVRARAVDECGSVGEGTVSIVIDNTPPTVVITEPVQCDAVGERVAVRGTIADANLGSWVLQYTGGPAHGWVTIASGSRPVMNSLIATWDTRDLPPCCYTLRVVATDTALLDCTSVLHNQTEYTVSVEIESCRGDLDADGDIDLQDLAYLLASFGTFCP